jgi:hypothetical protein
MTSKCRDHSDYEPSCCKNRSSDYMEEHIRTRALCSKHRSTKQGGVGRVTPEVLPNDLLESRLASAIQMAQPE